jgi:preprotein translocase subunit SecE
MFAIGGVVLFYLLAKSGQWGWDFLSTTDFAGDAVGKPREWAIDLFALMLAGGATVVAIKNEQLFELAGEVTGELRKVTWPTRAETFAATLVVIITVIVSSIFLGLFDLLWSSVSRLIYG